MKKFALVLVLLTACSSAPNSRAACESFRKLSRTPASQQAERIDLTNDYAAKATADVKAAAGELNKFQTATAEERAPAAVKMHQACKAEGF